MFLPLSPTTGKTPWPNSQGWYKSAWWSDTSGDLFAVSRYIYSFRISAACSKLFRLLYEEKKGEKGLTSAVLYILARLTNGDRFAAGRSVLTLAWRARNGRCMRRDPTRLRKAREVASFFFFHAFLWSQLRGYVSTLRGRGVIRVPREHRERLPGSSGVRFNGR